ncbi:MAG: AAA family ATPase [Chlamydiota bacterium]|nr:AAA family ATPase [Chlamydiota bacterium]
MIRGCVFVLVFLHAFSVICSEPPEHFKSVFQQQFPEKSTFFRNKPKFLVLFSGVPGMGKSTLAHVLEDEMEGVRISCDDARELLRKSIQINGNDDEIRLEEYLKYAFQRLEKKYPNHFIILDRSIDGIEESTLSLANDFGYKTFVIRIELSLEEVVRRLELREKDPRIHRKRLIRLERWFGEYSKTPIECFDYYIDMTPEISEVPIQQLKLAVQKALLSTVFNDSFPTQVIPAAINKVAKIHDLSDVLIDCD